MFILQIYIMYLDKGLERSEVNYHYIVKDDGYQNMLLVAANLELRPQKRFTEWVIGFKNIIFRLKLLYFHGLLPVDIL